MFGSLNKVQLIGTLGADPEIKSFSNGGKIANLRVACSESWKDRATGERKERTEWISVSVQAEGLVGLVERFLTKGQKVYVEGKLQTRKWQDSGGNDRYTTEVVIRPYSGEIIKLEKKDGGGSSGGSGGGYGGGSGGGGSDYSAHGFGGADQTGRSSRPQPAAFDTDLDDDVPF